MIMEHKLSSSIHSRIKKTVSLEVIILQVNLLGGVVLYHIFSRECGVSVNLGF